MTEVVLEQKQQAVAMGSFGKRNTNRERIEREEEELKQLTEQKTAPSVDDVPEDVKKERANEIMEIQSQISWDLNQEKIGKTFRCIIDRKEGEHFVGRTEFDSPDVDNEVLIDASKHYVKTGEFVMVKITEATEFDLYAEPV